MEGPISSKTIDMPTFMEYVRGLNESKIVPLPVTVATKPSSWQLYGVHTNHAVGEARLYLTLYTGTGVKIAPVFLCFLRFMLKQHGQLWSSCGQRTQMKSNISIVAELTVEGGAPQRGSLSRFCGSTKSLDRSLLMKDKVDENILLRAGVLPKARFIDLTCCE